MNGKNRLPRAVVLASAVALALAACAGDPAATDQAAPAASASASDVALPSESSDASSSSPSPSPAAPEDPARPVSGADLAGHIHNLAYDGRQLLIGTHEGLWGQDPGAQPTQVSDDAFDVMGFTPSAERWLASGHPGEGMDAPADLGLLQSTDQGRTWSDVSLSGEVDFHRLATSGAVVIGLNSADGRLLRSDDGGTSWTDLGVPGLYDLAMSPADSTIVIGTKENGPVRSTDAGATFQPIDGAPLLALVAWAGDTIYGADVDGQVWKSKDDARTWSVLGTLPAQPGALTVTGTTIAALVDDTILESLDAGATFAPRITGLGGH
jgi:hypothetical protein